MANETLENLFGGWLHQDWKPEFGTVANAMAQYASSEGPAAVAEALAGLAELAKSDEAALPGVLEEMGCYVSPAALGMTAKAFLTEVVAVALRAAQKPAPAAAKPAAPKKTVKKAAAKNSAKRPAKAKKPAPKKAVAKSSARKPAKAKKPAPKKPAAKDKKAPKKKPRK